MDISKKQERFSFFVWILVVPLLLFLAYTFFPSGEFNWLNMVLLFILLIITMLMPLRFQTVTISLERWITFVVFFQYGVLAEILFIQLGLLILLFSEKSALPLRFKFSVNSTMFAVTSLLSATIFHAFGGKIGMANFSHVLVIGFIYSLAYTLINNMLLKLYFHTNHASYSLRSQGALWDYTATIVIFPFSLSLYFLYIHLGNNSLLLVGIPFLLVLIVARMYNTSNDLNTRLTFAGDIGHELADQLRFDEVLETFLRKLKGVVPFDNGYIIDLRGGLHYIPLMGIEAEEIQKTVKGISFLYDQREKDGFDLTTSKIFHTKKEAQLLRYVQFALPTESVITAPIKRNNKTEGFLILTSKKKNTFQPIDVDLIDMLVGYLAISLEKARYFESTIEKSIRCGLTKLHNFRYLDAKLEEEIIRYRANQTSTLSVLLMDIDYFKKINDTYGHESGNDLLCKLSEILQSYVGPDETLARYGGEEFVIILPNTSKEYAVDLAEAIRTEVEDASFTIIPDLSEERTPIEVKMTISVGVATVPEDAADAKSILRNADRALYIGGKQAGRNRVGVYGSKLATTGT